MLVDDLIAPEPNAIIVPVKGEHVVDKRLRLGVVLRSVKTLVQHLFHELQVRFACEGSIEGQKGTRELQAISSELELIQGVNVLNSEFDARTLWRLHEPHKEISLLPSLQVYTVIA